MGIAFRVQHVKGFKIEDDDSSSCTRTYFINRCCKSGLVNIRLVGRITDDE